MGKPSRCKSFSQRNVPYRTVSAFGCGRTFSRRMEGWKERSGGLPVALLCTALCVLNDAVPYSTHHTTHTRVYSHSTPRPLRNSKILSLYVEASEHTTVTKAPLLSTVHLTYFTVRTPPAVPNPGTAPPSTSPQARSGKLSPTSHQLYFTVSLLRLCYHRSFSF